MEEHNPKSIQIEIEELKKDKDQTQQMFEDTKGMFKSIIGNFEGLRKDVNEYKLYEHQTLERFEARQQKYEAQSIVNHKFMNDLSLRLDRWEGRIKEIVHGAVQECTEFQVSELKDKLESHLKSIDPHPEVRKDKKNKKRELIKLFALIFSSMFGGGFTIFIIQNIPHILKIVGVVK